MTYDLLKRIYACAPEDLEASLSERSESLFFGFLGSSLVAVQDDRRNAQGLVVMLDAMEMAGRRGCLFVADSAYSFSLVNNDGVQTYSAPRRAEAVGLAFCAVFEKDKP